MRKSIFELENRVDINTEFVKLINLYKKDQTVYFDHRHLSFLEFLDEYVFPYWEYKDTFITVSEYLEFIGINESVFNGYSSVYETSFLNFLEFMQNMKKAIIDKYGFVDEKTFDAKLLASLNDIIPLIIEKLNYTSVNIGNMICIVKRDADVDSILNYASEDLSMALLSYNDIRKNNIESKRAILKEIDLYIESDKTNYKSINSELYDSIGTVVNKMGINHIIDEEPYSSLKEEEIMTWYDKCFLMMIHLIRSREVKKIKDERKKLVQKKQ